MSLTRIILVDDHTLFRKGLAELLEQSGSVGLRLHRQA
jgi:two-component system nitrate/nitrite response regulator NarL